jgi:hypothetical protein
MQKGLYRMNKGIEMQGFANMHISWVVMQYTKCSISIQYGLYFNGLPQSYMHMHIYLKPS